MMASSAVEAQSSPPATTFTISIERQPLAGALKRLAEQCGVQLIFFSRVTEGLIAPAITGHHSLNDAMEQLLTGSGLTFRVINPQTLEIRPRQARSPGRLSEQKTPAPPATGALVRDASRDTLLEEVVVRGLAEQLVATRIATPLHEIPQSVLIVPREVMRKQNLIELADVMKMAPGFTSARMTSLDLDYFSRGYPVGTLHIDGGAAINASISNSASAVLSPDLGEFDHVELLRGSDALFSGMGLPGGAIGMQRKTPQHSFALETSLLAGSWNKRRVEIDVTGPLAFEGALRGRADIVSSRHDYYYDSASLERTKIFAVLAYDLTPDATLTAGGSHQHEEAAPFWYGVPAYDDGRDSQLPRDTSYVFDWQRRNSRTAESYLQYRQALSDDWEIRANAARWDVETDVARGSFDYLIDSSTQALHTPALAIMSEPSALKHDTADFSLTGVTRWGGWRQEFAIGGDVTRFRWRSVEDIAAFDTSLADPRAFDPRAYPDPRVPGADIPEFSEQGVRKRYGGFASMRLFFNDAWSVVGGARVTTDKSDIEQVVRFTGGINEFAIEEHNSRIITPYAGVMYALNDDYSLYASYSDVYETPRILMAPDGGAPKLFHGVNMEMGIKGQWRNGTLNGSLVFYQLEHKNAVLDFAPRDPGNTNPGICCFVGSTSRTEGVELEMNGEIVNGWSLGAGYSFHENARPEVMNFAVTPKHLLKVWTSLRLPGAASRWTVGGNLYAQSSLESAAGYCTPLGDCWPLSAKQNSFAVVDLRAGYAIDDNWQIALNLNNVLDKVYYEASGFSYLHHWYGEPRNWTLRVDGRF